MSRLFFFLLAIQMVYVTPLCEDSIAMCPSLKEYCADINVQMQCQLTCGDCTPTECKDSLSTCPQYINSCDQVSIQHACPMTCGQCPKPTPTPSPCMDTSPVCPVISAQCADQTVKQTCPMTCGVCFPIGQCVDHLASCPQYSRPCSENMKLECPLTCGACDQRNGTTLSPSTPTTIRLTTSIRTTVPKETNAPTTITPTTKIEKTTTKKVTPKPKPCKDNSQNCAVWAKNGFCTNNFYTKEQKMEYCAKTCRLC